MNKAGLAARDSLMSERTYLSFDLRIEPWGDGYRAPVVGSPVGGGAAAHFTASTEEIVPLAWGDITEIRAFGQRLFDSVFDGEVRSFLRQSQEEVRQRGSPGLRIRLQLSDVPELGQLPWEYPYDPTPDNYLCLSKATPVVRYLDLPQRIRPLAVEPPLKVLVMIASPEDQPAVDADGEWTTLSGAVQQMEPRGRVVLERIEEASLNAL